MILDLIEKDSILEYFGGNLVLRSVPNWAVYYLGAVVRMDPKLKKMFRSGRKLELEIRYKK